MSNETFKVGERAMFVAFDGSHGIPANGEIVTITAGPFTDPALYEGNVGYFIQTDTGRKMDVGIVCLRKLPPPPPQREATSNWDDLIVWRPKETAHV